MARLLGLELKLRQYEQGKFFCDEIVREVADLGINVNYDAGNVMDYLDVDPIPDIRTCAGEVRSFCIKDHRNFPKDEDCGPGFGEIDHYRLLQPVAFTGRPVFGSMICWRGAAIAGSLNPIRALPSSTHR